MFSLILASDKVLQSVICKPAHNERVPLAVEGTGAEQTYTVQGFAYNGGGNQINRVELTLDGGKTWKYCFKRYLDKPLRLVTLIPWRYCALTFKKVR